MRGEVRQGEVGAPPLVTVVVPTHNRKRLLVRALESVLDQTYSSVEVIVVDDASSDGTSDLVERYAERGGAWRCLRHETPQGACAARNRGIREARGSLLTTLDDDDEWLPQRLERLVSAFDPSYAFVCSDYYVEGRQRRSLQQLPGVVTLGDMYYRNRVGNMVLVETAKVRNVGGFDEELEARQDYDLWLRLLEASSSHRAKVVQEPLHIIHKGHEERITSSPKARRGKLRFLRKHKRKMSACQRRFQSAGFRKELGRQITGLDRWCNWVIRKRMKFFPSRSWRRLR